ncbi:tyrosine-type recombinase/integrase [Mycobacterium sp. HM-7]
MLGVVLTWSEAIDLFLGMLAGMGAPATTIKLRRDQLTYLSRFLPAPGDVRREDIESVFGDHSWQLETRRSYSNAVRRFFGYLAEVEKIVEDPTVRLPKVPTRPPVARPAPDDVWAAAIMRADDRGRLMMRLAAEAGLRRSEVAKVHRRDLLAGPCLLVHGKGAKDRVIPISDDLARLIESADGWLFVGRSGGHIEPKSVGNIVSDLLPPGWSMHTLRHRFATRAYRATRDIRAVQMLLGHASIATTQRYLATSDEEMRVAMLAAA